MKPLTLNILLVSASLLFALGLHLNNKDQTKETLITNLQVTTICTITDPPIFLGLVGGRGWRAASFRDLCKTFNINEESLQIRIANLRGLNIDVSEELRGLHALRISNLFRKGFTI